MRGLCGCSIGSLSHLANFDEFHSNLRVAHHSRLRGNAAGRGGGSTAVPWQGLWALALMPLYCIWIFSENASAVVQRDSMAAAVQSEAKRQAETGAPPHNAPRTVC